MTAVTVHFFNSTGDFDIKRKKSRLISFSFYCLETLLYLLVVYFYDYTYDRLNTNAVCTNLT